MEKLADERLLEFEKYDRVTLGSYAGISCLALAGCLLYVWRLGDKRAALAVAASLFAALHGIVFVLLAVFATSVFKIRDQGLHIMVKHWPVSLGMFVVAILLGRTWNRVRSMNLL